MSFAPLVSPFAVAAIAAVAIGIAVWALVRGGSPRAWILRILLIVACAALALRPGIPDGSARTVTADVDVFLVVDSTTSITAEDWAGDEPRIRGVRDDVDALIEAYPGARFSLITFDNRASHRLPLTTDTTAVRSALEVLAPPTTAYAHGSDIARAAPMLTDALERASSAADADQRARLVFYFGDGEQTAPEEPSSFSMAADLIDDGAVFGYGTTAGGPMRVDSGDVDDETPRAYLQYRGDTALSTIDAAGLERIASELGVPYAHRTADAAPPIPDPPRTETTIGDDTLETRTELSWILALAAAALIAVDLARTARGLRQTLRAPTTTEVR